MIKKFTDILYNLVFLHPKYMIIPCKIDKMKNANEIIKNCTDVSGTPNYMAPEVLQCAMYENMPGTGKPVDLWVFLGENVSVLGENEVFLGENMPGTGKPVDLWVFLGENCK